MPRRTDPYVVFRFRVERDQREIGGFSQVAGLARETAVEEYREGGVNDYVHKLVTRTTYPNLVLKNGISDNHELWDWHQEVISRKVTRSDVAVVLYDERQREVRRWVFTAAYPVRWSSVELDSATNAVAVETLELAHHGMRLV